jgi:hypothetical protein
MQVLLQGRLGHGDALVAEELCDVSQSVSLGLHGLDGGHETSHGLYFGNFSFIAVRCLLHCTQYILNGGYRDFRPRHASSSSGRTRVAVLHLPISLDTGGTSVKRHCANLERSGRQDKGVGYAIVN